MIAYCGLLGSVHHRWVRVGRSKKEAWAEAERLWREEQDTHPAWVGNYGVMTEREAEKQRYRDGTKIYPTRDSQGYNPY